VIGLVEAVERGTVYAEQRRLPVRGVEPVEVDQQAHHAIIEAMAMCGPSFRDWWCAISRSGRLETSAK
jgi:hypothetical protein